MSVEISDRDILYVAFKNLVSTIGISNRNSENKKKGDEHTILTKCRLISYNRVRFYELSYLRLHNPDFA